MVYITKRGITQLRLAGTLFPIKGGPYGEILDVRLAFVQALILIQAWLSETAFC
jgi:hypothetical protein